MQLVELTVLCSDVAGSGCVGSGVPCKGIHLRSMAVATCDGPCLEVQSDMQFVAVLWGLGVPGRGPAVH